MESTTRLIGEHEGINVYHDTKGEPGSITCARGPVGEQDPECDHVVFRNNETRALSRLDGKPIVWDTRPYAIRFYVVSTPDIEEAKEQIEIYKKSDNYKIRNRIHNIIP